MNTPSRIITGTLVILFSLFLIILSILGIFGYGILVYGIPLFIIGIFIFFNKKEDDIEEIKNRED